MPIAATVTAPYEYFANPQAGRPVADGYIYIGVQDLDPEIPSNQIPVIAVQEDGTEVTLLQPIRTNGGGLPTYNGSVIQLKVEVSVYSIKVLDRNQVLVYYQDRALGMLNGSGGRTFDTLQEAADSDLNNEPIINTISFGSYSAPNGPKGGAKYYEDNTVGAPSTIYPNNRGFFDKNGNGFSLYHEGTIHIYQVGLLADGSTDDTVALQTLSDLDAGICIELPGGGTSIITGGISFDNSITLKCDGSFLFDVNIVSPTENFMEFPWNTGKPFNNKIIGGITVDMNDSGQDAIVMRGINSVIAGRLVLQNCGRDGLMLTTDATNSWFIENFAIDGLEVNGAGRNCLSFYLALKATGSFINEGKVTNAEFRQAGKNGAGTEVKFIVPENTYAACKIASINFYKCNIDQRNAARSEPYCIMVNRDSGVTDGATVEQIKFDSIPVENTSGTIAGSAVFYVDANCDNVTGWDIDRVIVSGGIAATFGGTSIKRAWYRDISGRTQFGDTNVILNANVLGRELVLTEPGNDGPCGASVISADTQTSSVLLGSISSPNRAGLIGNNNTDQLTIRNSDESALTFDTNNNMLPVSTGIKDIGSETLRYQHAHLSRLKLLDGISTPATVSGWAFLYVDSGTGDLMIKFGDGTIKTIVTDT